MRERPLVLTVALSLTAASAIWMAPRLHAIWSAPETPAVVDLSECDQTPESEPLEVVSAPLIPEVTPSRKPAPPPVRAPVPEAPVVPNPSTIPELANPIPAPQMERPIRPDFWECHGCGMG